MDLELAKFLFQVLTFLMTGGIGIYVYLSNKDKVTNDRIGKLEEDIREDITQQGSRIATLEARAENSPTHDDLGEIYEKISRVDTSVSTLAGEFSGVRNLLDTIHRHLLSGGKQ